MKCNKIQITMKHLNMLVKLNKRKTEMEIDNEMSMKYNKLQTKMSTWKCFLNIKKHRQHIIH